MRPLARVALATFVLGLAGGAYVLRPEPVSASGAFTGPFGGSSGGASSNGGDVTEATVLAALADAGTLNRSDRDTYANAFVAQCTSADGGTCGQAYSCAQSPCTWRFAAGTQMTLTAANNAVVWDISEMTVPQVNAVALTNLAPNDAYFFAGGTAFWKLFPTSEAGGCDVGSEGGLRALSSDNSLRYCNGTTLHQVALVIGPAAYTVDFPSIPSGGVGTTNVTVSGAAVGDGVIANPCATLENNLGGLQSRVSAANTVTIRGRNFDGVSALDPAACSYDITVIKQ